MRPKGCLILVAPVVAAAVAGAYFRGDILGAISGAMLGSLVAIALFLTLTIGTALRARRHRVYFLTLRWLSAIGSVVIAITWMKMWWAPSPHGMFRRAVCSYIPPGVEDIRGVVDYFGPDHRIRVRFKTERGSIDTIISRGGFHQMNELAPETDLEKHALSARDEHLDPRSKKFLKQVAWWTPEELVLAETYVASPKNELERYLWFDTANQVAYFMENAY